MKKQRHLSRALPIVASSLGDKFGVEVAVAGDTAFTNGQRVVIPAFDPEDDKMKALAYGYLAHEAGGHIRHTDFSVFQAAGQNPLRHGMLNSIEDVRVEIALWEDFPGTRRQLFDVAEYVFRDGGFRVPRNDAHPAKILDAYVLIKLRHDLHGMDFLAEELAKAESLVQETFPKGAITRLNAMLGQVVKLESTRDALFLTDEILAMLKEEEDKAREEAQQQQQQAPDQEDDQSDPDDASSAGPQGQGDGDDQPQQGQGDDAADGSDDQSQQGQDGGTGDDGSDGQDGSDSGSNSAGQQAGDSSDASGSNSDTGSEGASDGSGDAAKADALAQALSASGNDVQHEDTFAKVGQMISQGARQAPPASRVPTMPKAEKAPASYGNDDRLSQVRCTSNKVRAQLHGLVQASQLRRPITKRQGQRIDTARMTRVIAGDSRIFLQKDKKVAPNAAVHLLVDRSVSMKHPDGKGRQRLDVALDAALALSLALEGISGVNPGVSAFPSNTGRGDLVTILKPHGSSVRANAKNFNISTSGCTPMAEGMWFAVSQLLRQREERKLLIVVTDGEPDRADTVRQLVARCEESGIEAIGIGIQEQSVKSLFPQSEVIHDVGELRSALFGIAEKALIAA